ncbi:pyridoxal phosphate-dependent aminotransferase [Pseudomonas typographi]|uniref:Aminotransferase n=1 Tax=Pseudomonas typographi TaxID=2715964 RepID=A0ABR7Z440_9PSED|nr:pyridoxal phosphate-dependent aminotransferase [Pseudomonas typographi]MBD1552935.1 pyridoxal phosphate-dependent aminotransferase [Pseudomonas typographi]MBD1588310.1 pyridoxal phosphate-dependent aminotransferase [Pseudomonas typographi]MBD1600281.1 pyridoxal phosphate-dependent aminotransferase [Pseudomonas typographi]
MSVSLLAQRMRRVRPSPTAEISDKVRALTAQGHRVINLGEGELDFATPAPIAEAGVRAIRAGMTKYTAVPGTPQLKQAIIDKFARDNGLAYQPCEVIAGAGAKQLIFNAFLATLDAGSEVIIPAPYWVSYPDMVALAEGVPRIVECAEAEGWKLSPAKLEAAITPRTRWVILNSPNNPTGAVYSAAELKALTDVLLRHPHVAVLADDIYEHTRYVAAFATPAQVEPRLKSRTLTVNGVSKAFSMTGWRIGYAAGPQWLIDAMGVLQSQSTSNPSSISQAAAVAALEGGTGFIKDWLGLLGERRDRVLQMVQAVAGMSAASPEGAFYVFVNCAGLLGGRTASGTVIDSDLNLANYLLDTAHVGTVHGSAFGAPGYLRIAYAVDMPVLDEACTRIAQACAALSFSQPAA